MSDYFNDTGTGSTTEPNPYCAPRHDQACKVCAGPLRLVAAWLKAIGLLLFLACLPLDILGGRGRGFIADANDFQGYDIVLTFGIILPLFGCIIYIPVSLAIIFTLVIPFLNVSECRHPNGVVFTLLGNAISLVAIAVLGSWEDGVYGWFYLWATAVVAVNAGASLQALTAGQSKGGQVESR